MVLWVGWWRIFVLVEADEFSRLQGESFPELIFLAMEK